MLYFGTLKISSVGLKWSEGSLCEESVSLSAYGYWTSLYAGDFGAINIV